VATRTRKLERVDDATIAPAGVVISTRLDADTARRLFAAAERTGVAVGTFVRDVLRQHVDPEAELLHRRELRFIAVQAWQRIGDASTVATRHAPEVLNPLLSGTYQILTAPPEAVRTRTNPRSFELTAPAGAADPQRTVGT